jgi:hypothetical protein
MPLQPEPDEELLRLVGRIAPEGSLLQAWPLKGGVSAQMMAIEIAQPGGRRAVQSASCTPLWTC